MSPVGAVPSSLPQSVRLVYLRQVNRLVVNIHKEKCISGGSKCFSCIFPPVKPFSFPAVSLLLSPCYFYHPCRLKQGIFSDYKGWRCLVSSGNASRQRNHSHNHFQTMKVNNKTKDEIIPLRKEHKAEKGIF